MESKFKTLLPQGGIDIEYKVSAMNAEFSMHIHHHYEIYFALNSGNTFFVDNSVFEIKKFDLFLLDSSNIHMVAVNPGCQHHRYVISFAPNIIKSMFAKDEDFLKCFDKEHPKHTYKLSLLDKESDSFLIMFKEMLTIQNSNDYAKNAKMRLLLFKILININEIMFENKRKFAVGSFDSDASQRVYKVMKYINENFAQNLNLEVISKEFFVDKFYLCKLFKSITGMGINKYIQSVRLGKAVSSLQQGFNVTETATKCGFATDTYFISTFSKQIGVSPKKYSQQYKKGVGFDND